ncbi:hypothetical protein ABW636_22325 [Aquimarina sp. 2201CG1-2-11]|uniref:hypothetical protein n=1 Tax=Aquimarina discodermiae TaxID=3231043 RepID=UPI003462C373
MKKCILSLVALCAILVSCEQDKVIFSESQTFVKFEESNQSFTVNIGQASSEEIPVIVSSVSSSERSISVEVLEEETTLASSEYTVGTIVIPANSYEGVLTVGFEDAGVEASTRVLVLKVPTSADFSGGDQTLSVSINQLCPVDPNTFVGNYTVSFADPIGLDAGTFNGGLAFADDVTYELVLDPDNPARRVMQIVHQPKFCSGRDPIPFEMDFLCGNIIVPFQPGECVCTADGRPDWHGPSSVPGSYDINDDSTFIVRFEENAADNCTSYDHHEAEVTFTKVP